MTQLSHSRPPRDRRLAAAWPPQVGLPFRCLVPYRLLSLTVAEKDLKSSPTRALAQAERLPPPLLERMRSLVALYGRDLLWRHPRSRVAENVLLEAARVLSSRRDATRRDAGDGGGAAPRREEGVDCG